MSKHFKQLVPIILLLALTLPATFSLFKHGLPSTQDGFNHVLRISEFSKALDDGQFPPRWASRLTWGFGTPALIYYGFAPYFAASMIAKLGFTFPQTFKILMGLSLILSAVTFFYWTRRRFGIIPALCGALIYTWSPYRFVDVYVRGALPEAITFIFFPLLFWAADNVRAHFTLSKIIGTLSIFFLILSHSVVCAVLIGIYFLYSLIRTVEEKNIYPTISGLFNISYGLLLSAFFWVPSIFEANLINLPEQLKIWDFKQNFIPLKDLLYSPWGWGGLGSTSPMSMQFGITQWLILAICSLLVLTILVTQKHKFKFFKLEKNHLQFLLFFLLITYCSLFLVTPFSQFIWKLSTPVNYFLYPWRYLTIAVFSISAVSTILIYKSKYKLLFAIILTCLLLYSNKNHTKLVGTNPETNTFYERIVDTSDINGEFLPKTADQSLIPGCRETRCAFKPIEDQNFKAEIISTKSNLLLATIELPNETKVSINRFYFPGWALYVDGVRKNIIVNKLGAIDFVAPPGKHELNLVWKETNLRLVADFVSILGAMLFLAHFVPVLRTRYLTKNKKVRSLKRSQ